MTNIKKFTLGKSKTDFPSVKICNSTDSSNFIRQFYSDDIEIFESFFLLLLNRANKTIGYAKISQGGVAGTVVDIRIVCKYAVDALASAAIIAHNHPSGNLNPSEADVRITEKIKNALTIFDVKLLDHIILTAESFYSFADEGRL